MVCAKAIVTSIEPMSQRWIFVLSVWGVKRSIFSPVDQQRVNLLVVSVFKFSVIASSVNPSVLVYVIVTSVIVTSVIVMAFYGIERGWFISCSCFLSPLLKKELVELDDLVDRSSKGIGSSVSSDYMLYLGFESTAEHAAFGLVVKIKWCSAGMAFGRTGFGSRATRTWTRRLCHELDTDHSEIAANLNQTDFPDLISWFPDWGGM